jgi:hypothetical protein
MASDSERLLEFITAARARGVGDDFVVTLLRQNGWSERRIYQAFSTYYEGVLGAPVPNRGGRVEYAGDAFLYLLTFISLGVWTFALGSLFYASIDRWVPDAVVGQYANASFRETVTYQLAALIVAFPIFLWVSRLISTGLRARPETSDSGVRTWLTYLALVVAAVSLLGDAIWFLQGFLHGDLTTPFVLKSLVLLALAGGIFVYYLGGLRGEAVNVARDRAFAGIAGAAAIAGLAFGFLGVGDPAHSRAVSADEKRVSQLADATERIHDFYTSQNQLPKALGDMPRGDTLRDPIDDRAFEYRPLGASKYSLCANFEETDRTVRSGDFKHASGRVCYDLDASLQYSGY